MFRKELKEKLEKIFLFEKSTFNAPSDNFEQDTLFIQINQPHVRITQGKAYAKVMGYLTCYSQQDKLPYGYFNQLIAQADAELSKNFFFFDIDVDVATSPARIQNISERKTGFVFLYSAQYDPNQGAISSLEMEGCQ